MASAARSRIAVAAALAVTIAVGLASRSTHPWVPGWCREHAGDALWAACAFFALAFGWAAAATHRLAAAALGVACVVELSQLWHPPLLVAARGTQLGALLLGRGFVWADLPRYAAGVALAAALDRAVLVRRRPTGPPRRSPATRSAPSARRSDP